MSQDEKPVDETVSEETTSPETETKTVENGSESLEKLRAQSLEYLEGWQRSRAEFSNYKKRAERELSDSTQAAAADVLTKFLPVIDDFERALENVPQDLNENAWVGGVTLIMRKIDKVLVDLGIEAVDPTGQPFDPIQHQAIGTDTESDAENGTVTQTMQKGYVIGERVVRPALVRVKQ